MSDATLGDGDMIVERAVATTDVGGRVAVCDTVGALDAMLVAEWLADGAAERVTLVTGRIHVGEGEGITSLFPFIRRPRRTRGAEPFVREGDGGMTLAWRDDASDSGRTHSRRPHAMRRGRYV